MILRFKVQNHRSFREMSELSLIETSLQGPRVASVGIPPSHEMKALPCAFIYGANASGKSNFLKAFRFYRAAILNSHRRGSIDGGVPRDPFRLIDGRDDESFFEADFVSDGVRYTLGFTCDDEKFLEEWLYSFPEGKKRTLYERAGDKVVFGSKFTGPKKGLVDFMRHNSLFISTATQNDHPELTKIVKFVDRCSYMDYMSVSGHVIEDAFKDDEIDQSVIKFLNRVGTGVIDYRSEIKKVPDDVKELQKELKNLFNKRLGNDNEIEIDEVGDNRVSIELGHRGVGGKTYFLRMDRESSGTRRLLIILKNVIKSLQEGSALFIDELDTNLHTLAAEEIVRLYQDQGINRHGAQLIATTHDTNLLSCKDLRRDQIWFCERDDEGGSELYSLAEIRSRSGDNFEKGYLEGRYGAIPFAGDSKVLLEDFS